MIGTLIAPTRPKIAAIFGVVASATLRVVFARVDEAPVAVGEQRGRTAAGLCLPPLIAAAWLGMGMPVWLWDRLGSIAREISP